ncbi:MAG: Stk1 family PASTA domain-containing Ser/Thr kinase [Coriobacteriales bacterium]|nr:Stk1 family PASTA domain-containing Ser/Thr kinase [Coriobacteriales bacterium]
MATVDQGTVFGGRYVVQSQVGTGGMATVYRGVDSVLNRTVAIKVMLPQYATDPAFAARFKQEAQAAAALQSPYIVAVYDWGRDDATGTYYIVMEYLRGTDLKTGIRSHGALPPRKVAQIGAQVCSALAVAHAHDIIHRDIKPQNIMIQPNGNAKVMDFGIARAGNSHLTQTNSVLGTAHYVSPEQAQGKDLGPTSDLYSLGVVMYEAATGQLPFDGEDAVSVALKQVSDEPALPSSLNPNIDTVLESIILRLMSKNPANRFQTADELRRVLNDYIMGRPVKTPVVTSVLGAGTTMRQTVRTQAMPNSQVNIGGTITSTSGEISSSGARMIREPFKTSRANPGTSSNNRAQQRSQTQSEKPNHTALIVTAVTVGVIALVAMIIIWVSSCSTPSTPAGNNGNQNKPTPSQTSGEVSMPNLINQTQSDATSILNSNGLNIGHISTAPSDIIAEGKVVSQTPEANQQIVAGSYVDLVISSGTDKVAVPSLLGKTEAEAATLANQAGIKVTRDYALDAYSSDYPENTIAYYQPANQTVTKGTTVRYGLSKGVDPATLKVVVPGVVGWYYGDAQYTIELLELQTYIAWEHSETMPDNCVIRLEPDEGTELSKHEVVTIYVSSGPAPYTLPDYAADNWSWQAAQNDLLYNHPGLQLNVTVDTSQIPPTPEQAGKVTSVYPVPGTEISRGATVTLTAYGDYPHSIVPNVNGRSLNEAYSIMTNEGFSAVALDTDGNPIASYDGYTVAYTDPSGDSSQPVGSTIYIYATPPAPEPENSSDSEELPIQNTESGSQEPET